MTLSRKEILAAMRRGEISIAPFDASCVGAVSIDLHLGGEFAVFAKKNAAIEVCENSVFPSKKVSASRQMPLRLAPMQFVLGVTRERITLSPKYCARIEGRSRFARLGLMVHISSSLIHPGSDNVQVLEIVNLSPATLLLRPGEKICQVTFEKLSSPAEYHGKFKTQTGV
ncbi:MAG: dCTP deaminase [Candidatus Micrarchaeota archaeon]